MIHLLLRLEMLKSLMIPKRNDSEFILIVHSPLTITMSRSVAKKLAKLYALDRKSPYVEQTKKI